MSDVPDGYRTGFITALTVFLGFSLAFVRFWTIEAPGEWSPKSFVAVVLLALSILFQLFALFRALDIRDHNPTRYRVTVRWFFAGVVTLIVGVGISIVASNVG